MLSLISRWSELRQEAQSGTHYLFLHWSFPGTASKTPLLNAELSSFVVILSVQNYYLSEDMNQFFLLLFCFKGFDLCNLFLMSTLVFSFGVCFSNSILPGNCFG